MMYSVLIRTFNSEATLPGTLASLKRQSAQPSEVIIVDSGSSDRTLSLLPSGAVLHRYEGNEFNYSEALNQGLSLVKSDVTLILSSHTSLQHVDGISYGLQLLSAHNSIGAAYFVQEYSEHLLHDVIQLYNFDGFNGLWNTCALIRTKLLRERGFRPEVFAAEDQEWASWLFSCKGMSIARIRGAGMVDKNPRGRSRRKRLNEHVAIAYFAHRRLLGLKNLFKVALRVVIRDRVFNAILLSRLIACRFFQPKGKSRYF
jgi:glycosyltransferase involved in cell wall biosynthesis